MGNELTEAKKQEVETSSSNEQNSAKGRLLEDYLNSSDFKTQNDLGDKFSGGTDATKNPAGLKDGNPPDKKDGELGSPASLPELSITDAKNNNSDEKGKNSENEEISDSEDANEQIAEKGEGENKSKDDDDSKQKDSDIESNKPADSPQKESKEGKQEGEDEAGKSAESGDPQLKTDESGKNSESESEREKSGETDDADADKPASSPQQKGGNEQSKAANHLPELVLVA